MAGTGQTVEGAAPWLAHPAFSYNPGPPAQTGVTPLTESWALPRKSLIKKNVPASQSDGNNSSSEVPSSQMTPTCANRRSNYVVQLLW